MAKHFKNNRVYAILNKHCFGDDSGEVTPRREVIVRRRNNLDKRAAGESF